MKRELEIALENRCVERVEAAGGLALKLQIVGVRGFPDRSIFFPSRAPFFVEFKRDTIGRVSKQQEAWLRRMKKIGLNIYVVNSDDAFEHVLTQENLS